MPEIAGKWIVETSWLADHLSAPDLIVLDGSWHLPSSNRNARVDYKAAHIPNALFFDIEEIADEDSDLPHMLPSTVKFASHVKKMGIGDGMRVVVYDSDSLFSAARVWWTFRVMGHDDVFVLNGGLAKWRREGRPVDDLPPPMRTERHFTPRFNRELVHDLDDIKALLGSNSAQIVDARPTARFEGAAAEPRGDMRVGHIPGSRTVPYALVLNEDGTLKTPGEIAALFAAAGVDTAKPIVTTCGSGVTASVLALALAHAGITGSAVYDGSWSEWGADHSLPIETGPAR